MATDRYRFTRTVHYLTFTSRLQILCCLVATLVSVTNTEPFTITRGFTENGSNKLEDIFTLPYGLPCYKDSNVCSTFDAIKRPRQPCLCECPKSKTTFQLHNGKWRCINNTDVRTHEGEGCSYSFNRAQKRTPSAPLRVVDRNFFSYLYPARDVRRWNCRVATRKSFYQLCSGEWKSLSSPLTYFRLFVMPGTNFYGFQVNEVERRQYTELDGKMIKLFIKCRAKTSDSNGCLLFKTKGSFNCSDITPSVATTLSASSSVAGVGSDTTPTMVSTTSHNENKSNSTVESPGESWSPLTAITAGVVSAVVLFLVMAATVGLFLIRRGKKRRDAVPPKDHSGDAAESEYCDPAETCTNFDLERKSTSKEIDDDENPSHNYQPLMKVEGRDYGDYQALVKMLDPEDDPIYSSPYQVTKLTSTFAKDEKKDDKLGIPCRQSSRESCGDEIQCQTDINGYELPINSELPDYVMII